MSGSQRWRPYHRLLAALAPDPTRWEWRGESIEAAHYGEHQCACGQPILRLHPIHRRITGRTLVIGAICGATHFIAASRARYGQLSFPIARRFSSATTRAALTMRSGRSAPYWTQNGRRAPPGLSTARRRLASNPLDRHGVVMALKTSATSSPSPHAPKVPPALWRASEVAPVSRPQKPLRSTAAMQTNQSLASRITGRSCVPAVAP